ncbi:MAG TPA: 4'-phosphopantetheinyl transferase superfamily protein [Anaerolineae bacterium]
MIHWLIQSVDAYPDLRQGLPPAGLLSAEEQGRYAGFKSDKRRRDWLLGRWTAKKLVQSLTWESSGSMVPLDQFIVRNDADGVPTVNCQSPIVDCQLNISISHSSGYALCAVVADGVIGADIERIEKRADGFAEDYFTEGELERIACSVLPIPLHGRQYAMRDTLTTAIWSAKEAVLKALHLGLSVDTRSVSCLVGPTANPPRQWMPFAIELDEQRLNRPAPALAGWWRTHEEHVLTLVRG